MMTAVQQIAIEQIAIGDRLRAYREDRVPEIAASIAALGLLEPIVVIKADDGYRLVAGRHRLAACRALGWDDIAAVVLEADELDAQLAEIDENLARFGLSVLERGEHLLRRQEILEARGERAPRGRPRKPAAAAHLLTTADLAKAAKVSTRTAQESIKLARELPLAVRDVLRPTTVARSQGILSTLAAVKNRDDQLEIATLLASGSVSSVYDGQRAIVQRYSTCLECGEVLDGYQYRHQRAYHCYGCGGHSPDSSYARLCGRCGASAASASPTATTVRTPAGLTVSLQSDDTVGSLPQPFYRKGGHKQRQGIDIPLPDEQEAAAPASERAFKFAEAVDALTALDVEQLRAEAEQAVVKLALRQLDRWLAQLRAPALDAAGVNGATTP